MDNTRDKVKASAERQNQLVAATSKRCNIPAPPYDFKELVGKGNFGQVFKAIHTVTGRTVAVKILNMEADESNSVVRDASIELAALRDLKQKKARNIVFMLDLFSFDAELWIVQEYCAGGNVHALMKAREGGRLEEPYIVVVARELAEAIKWVHSAGVIHRDIKAANVLVDDDGSVMLCDFGVAAVLQETKDKRSTVLGTLNYMAPEIYTQMDVKYGRDVDIWAFGCTVYEMATGMPPNSNLRSEHALATHYAKGQAPRLEGGNWSSSLREFIAMCLEEKPVDRPEIEAVQKHKYIFNTQKKFPTSSLKSLIMDYKMWEATGGKRQSLFSRAGAQQSEFVDDKHFSTQWNFDDDSLSFNSSEFGPPLGQQPPLPRQSVETHHLLQLFQKAGQQGPPNQSPGQSDLAFRNLSSVTSSSPRHSQIDLGEYDSETGVIHIPDLTYKGTTRRNMYDSDEESEKEDKPADLTAKPGVFKFPMAPPPPEPAATIKKSPRSPPKNAPFVFPPPVSSRPPTPGEPRRLQRAHTATVLSPRSADMLGTESASAPSSPPRSANEDALRPATASSDLAFDASGKRGSFHKQTRSGPPNLVTNDKPAEEPAPAATTETSLTRALMGHSRSSTRSRSANRSTSSDSAGVSRSPRHYLRQMPASATSATFASRYRHFPQMSSDFSTTSETDEERVIQQQHSDDEELDYDDSRPLVLPVPMPPSSAAMEVDAPAEILESELTRLLTDFVDTLQVFRVGMERADRKGRQDDDSTPVAMAKKSPLLAAGPNGTNGVS